MATTTRRLLWVLGAIAAASLSLVVDGPPRLVLAIVLFTMVLWVGEVLPLAVTALTSSVLLVLVAGFAPREVFASYFDPVVVLLLGGFFLGVALQKHGLDETLAGMVMRRAGRRPARVLLALMLTTATFSMWISNTAATAIMLPIALGVVTGPKESASNLARTLVLGVAFSANVGGIATPIGTTPNPIALRFLADAGYSVSFLGWMARMLPLTIALVFLLWFILMRVYPLGQQSLGAPAPFAGFTKRQKGLVGVFVVTVALWLTTDLHGVSAAVVAVLPIVLLYVFGLLDETDIHKVGWPTLLLIGGGLALGTAASASGLDGVFAGAINAHIGGSGILTFAIVGVAALVLTIMASNTAAAVIIIPIVVQLGSDWGASVRALTLLTAAVLSLDFMVPVGTPPNAMAYGTGHVNVAEMARAGVWASLAGVTLAVLVAYWLW